MTRTVYELRFYHGEHLVDRQTINAVLDLDDDPEGTERLLNGHILGAAIRSGGDRSTAHEFVVEVWSLVGSPRHPETRWAMPYEGEWL